jgi:phospholipid/cholesterol/gamma-HCH transport system substrate-binding protein
MTDRNVRRCAFIGLGITAVLVFLTMSIGGLNILEKRRTIKADFASASGVKPGDPVRVAGVKVGEVTGVDRLAKDPGVRVSMSIDKGAWLAESARASIRLRTMLGSRYVSLETRRKGAALASDAVIPGDRTEVPVELDETLDAVDRVARPFDVDNLNRFVDAFADGLEGHAPKLNQMLHDMAGLAQTLAKRSDDIDRLIAATATLSTAVDDRREALGSSIDDLGTVLDVLAARRDDLASLVTGVKGLSDRLAPLLARNQGKLDGTLTDLVTTVGVLDKQRARLDLVLGNLPEFAKRLTKVTDDGSFINVYYVGSIPGPYASDPVNLGANDSGEPGEDGGLPRIWVQPPAHAPSGEAGGTKVDGEDDTPPPPEGYPAR